MRARLLFVPLMLLALPACAVAQSQPGFKAEVFNTAKAANANLLATSLTPGAGAGGATRVTTYSATISIVTTATRVRLTATQGVTTVNKWLNEGNDVAADTETTLTWMAASTTTYNLQLEDAATVSVVVVEVPSAIATVGRKGGSLPTPGTSGYVLTSNGPTSPATYQAASGGGGETLAQTLALGADANGVAITGLGSLAAKAATDVDVRAASGAAGVAGRYIYMYGGGSNGDANNGGYVGCDGSPSSGAGGKTWVKGGDGGAGKAGGQLSLRSGGGNGAGNYARLLLSGGNADGSTPSTLTVDAGTIALGSPTITCTDTATWSGAVDFTGEFHSKRFHASYTSSHTVTAQEARAATLDNTGASALVTFTLPASAVVGWRVTFRVSDADGVKILADSTTLTAGPNTTASSGYFQSTTLNSTMSLEYDGTNWVADSVTGVWRRDTTSGAGFAYTPQVSLDVADPTMTWTASLASVRTDLRQVGDVLYWQVAISLNGAPTSAWLQLTSFPGGIAPSAAKLGWNGATNDYLFLDGIGVTIDTSGHATRGVTCCLKGSSGASDGSIYVFHEGTSGAAGSGVLLYATLTEAQPYPYATGDSVVVRGCYPVD
jgi:hypothetical protein